MGIKIALAGNPNAGKTTLFNALTGSNQFVGNWPGVTVEKKEGKLKGHKDVIITDLPGIYSLSPYTLEEVVARNYLIQERPDAILNIIDGTNLERNLYLTTQLVELGIPVVVAINMMDIVRKNGDQIRIDQLAKELGCKVVEISALKGTGIDEAAKEAMKVAESKVPMVPQHKFGGCVEHAIAHIEEACLHDQPEEQQRWYAIKIFERDDKVLEQLNIPEATKKHVEQDIEAAEKEMDDDAESIITNERYLYIASIIKDCLKKKKTGMTTSDRSTRSLPTVGWVCRSSQLSCSWFTTSPWLPLVLPQQAGQTTDCSAMAGTCWASAQALIMMQQMNTATQTLSSTAMWHTWTNRVWTPQSWKATLTQKQIPLTARLQRISS